MTMAFHDSWASVGPPLCSCCMTADTQHPLRLSVLRAIQVAMLATKEFMMMLTLEAWGAAVSFIRFIETGSLEATWRRS